jgi:DNA-binding MurR/RpiR family transcriptional regulator
MPNALIKIKSLYASFSPAQKRLADYILEKNGEEVPFLSVRELARAVGVSVASISRFARVMGFESLKGFKAQLGKDSLSAVKSMYRVIGPEDTAADIIEKVFAGNIRSLEETLKILDRDDLVRAAAMVAKAARVVFFGIGSSGNIGHDAALRFSQLDIQAEAYSDSYQMLNQALRMKKGEVALGISTTGRSAMTVEALQLASKGGATTIGISNCMKSPLHKASHVFFCTSFPESRVTVAGLSPLVAQVCLIDAIYLLAARQKKAALGSAERMNAHTERALRLPAK